MAYFHRNKSARSSSVTDPNSFFFPLDAIAGWNRLYGPRGLFQHQSLIPLDAAKQIIPNLLSASHQAGQGSFLTVLKRFGGTISPGFMSFPQPGYTLTLDFANRGTSTRQLLDRLDAITLDAGGRVNPYKDARMSAETFQRGYRLWQNLEKKRDPAIRSDFWQRTTSVIDGSRRQLSAPSLVSPVNQAAKGEIHTQNVQPEQDKPPVRPAATGST
jgi:FAD/FMN-containing dehydrogenase